MRAALSSFGWLPGVAWLGEDFAFIGGHVLPHELASVAEADGDLVGFIAVHDEWVNRLYLLAAWAGKGIGQRLLAHATAGKEPVTLHCFQANTGAHRFYERHGFVAASSGDGNEEGLPHILYVRRS